MTPTLTVTLPAALLLDPAHNSALMRHADYHALMRATRGTVTLRHREWHIEARRLTDDYVRIYLSKA